MCGLVGVFGNLTHREKTAFKWLLHLDVLRGPHSTGIAAVHLGEKEDIYGVYKKVGTPEEIYRAHPKDFVDGVYDYTATDCLIGHNRYATIGEVNEVNAHPFEFENVIGAHNGTVNMWSLKGLHDAAAFKVDSQIIYSQLNHSAKLQTVWDAADGALALSWFDKRDRMLHLARNAERPLHYCYTKDRMTVFWASEPWMLETILDRVNIYYHPVQPVPMNRELSFSIPDYGTKIAEFYEELTPFAKKPLAPVLPPVNGANWLKKSVLKIVEFCQDGPDNATGYFVGHTTDVDEEIIIPIYPYAAEANYKIIMDQVKAGRPWFEYLDSSLWYNNGFLNVLPSRLIHLPNLVAKEPEDTKKDKVVFRDFYGKELSRKDWHRLLMNGSTQCVCCATKIDHHKAADVIWLDEEELVCGECASQSWVQEWMDQWNSGNTQPLITAGVL